MRKPSTILLERWGKDPDGLGKSIDKGMQAVQAHRTIELQKPQSKPASPAVKGKGWKMIFGKWRKVVEASGSPIGPIHQRMKQLVAESMNARLKALL